MEIVIPQNREIWQGKLFGALPTTMKCAESHGNKVTILEPFPCPMVDEFRTLYRHNSPNGELFERWCFETWLYLAQWMVDHNRDVVFRCDSDCLVFANLDEVYEGIGKPPFTVPTSDSFVTRETVQEIADYLLNAFGNGDGVSICAPNHVADIYMMYKYAARLEGAVNLIEGKEIIDTNLFHIHTCTPFEKHKDIWFENGIPYWHRLDRKTRMLTIHCWGPAKARMTHIYEQSLESVRTKKPVRLTLN